MNVVAGLLPELSLQTCNFSFAEAFRLAEDDFHDVLGIFGGDAAVVFEADLTNAERHRVGHEATCYLIFLAILSEQCEEAAIVAVEEVGEVIVDVLTLLDACEHMVVFGDDDTDAVGGILQHTRLFQVAQSARQILVLRLPFVLLLFRSILDDEEMELAAIGLIPHQDIIERLKSLFMLTGEMLLYLQ